MRCDTVNNQTDQSDRSDGSDQTVSADSTPYARYRAFVEDSPAETAANTVICLIHPANYLLDRQLQQLEREFIESGGYTEQLAAARRRRRGAMFG